MNNVNLIGRLTADPAFRGKEDKEFLTFTLAVDNSYAGKKSALFFDIVLYDDLAKRCVESLNKGSKVAVSGKLSYTDKDYEGTKKRFTNIIANYLEYLDNKEVKNEK